MGRILANLSFFELDLMDQVMFEGLCGVQLYTGDNDMRTRDGTWDVTIAKCGIPGTHLIKFKVDSYKYHAIETVQGCYVKGNLGRIFLVASENLLETGDVVTVMVSGKRGSSCTEEGRRECEVLETGIKVQVAIISTNDEREISELIGHAMEKVEKQGVITFDNGNTLNIEFEVVEWMKLGRGFSPYFVTNKKTQNYELDNLLILLRVISNMNLEIDAPVMLVISNQRADVRRKEANLEDLVVLIGGDVTGEERGSSLDKIDVLHTAKERCEEDKHGCELRIVGAVGTSKSPLLLVRHVNEDHELETTQGDVQGSDAQGAVEHGIALGVAQGQEITWDCVVGCDQAPVLVETYFLSFVLLV
ncbi:hypothetical protein POM88_028369 [Heracleum sosnowskyi]|uniref:Uncharacterized protein n=1 Tax=Heracleum sosnowskyi TaxID=360622 RepID=A0AAD8ICV1_9APIA|nr:hypothetical protein POM88_028369 [Heracleum sosnowskyi]